MNNVQDTDSSSTRSGDPAPLDPRWIPSIPFTCRLTPAGEFTFDAPERETRALLEASPAELSAMLNERSIPFVQADEKDFWASIQKSAQELTPWRRELHTRGVRTGRDIWTRIHSIPAREPDGTVLWKGTIYEVTDLKQTQERLWQAYQHLSSHLDNTPLAVVEWQGRGQILRWSSQAERLFGWSASDVVGKIAFDLGMVHPEDVPKVLGYVEDLIERRTLRNHFTCRVRKKDGSTLICEAYNSVVLNEQGQVQSVLTLGLDVTDRVRTQEALARSQSLLQSAIDAAGILVWEWDITIGRIEYSGDFAAYFGLPAGVDYGDPRAAHAALHPDERQAVLEAFDRMLREETDFRLEFRGAAPHKDGRERWFVSRGQIIRDPQGLPQRVLAVTIDVTQQKRSEIEKALLDQQLQEIHKAETLGVLAGGLAHDFNNLLTIVLGNASLVRKAVSQQSEVLDYLDQIESACQRAAHLCRQMLAYAGQGPMQLTPLAINRVIRDAKELLSLSWGGKVRIEYTLPEPSPVILADESQFRQVLIHLVMNATEAASQEGGRVFVRTGTLDLSTPEPAQGFVPAPALGSYAVLDIADNGPGMSEAVRTRAFEPFFTTKFTGRGLGLSAVLGILRAHHGAIRIDSTPGRGTLARVIWPLAPSLEGEKTGSPSGGALSAAEKLPLANPGMALVVDDELYVREVAASLLEEMGFQTRVADSAASAMEVFAADRAAIRVAIVDVVMPGSSGVQLVNQLRAAEPTLPVLFISGFTEQEQIHSLGGSGPTLFLAKPFLPEELTDAVQRLLTATSQP